MYNILFVLLFVVIVFIISRRVIRTKKYSKYESNGSDIVQRFINKKQKEPYKPVFDFTEENDESVECIDTKLFQETINELAKETLRFATDNKLNKLLICNQSCSIDTIIFVSYIINNSICKELNNEKFTYFYNTFKHKIIELTSKTIDIDTYIIERLVNDRYVFYNNQCEHNINQITYHFKKALIFNKVQNKFDKISSINTYQNDFVNNIDFNTYLELDPYLISFYNNIISTFENSIIDVIRALTGRNLEHIKFQSLTELCDSIKPQIENNQHPQKSLCNKTKTLFHKIIDLIYNKLTLVIYILESPIILTCWFLPGSFGAKLALTLFLVLYYPFNLFTNLIFGIYIIFSKNYSNWNIATSIIALIVLLLIILAIIANVVISNKKDNKKTNKRILAIVLIVIIVFTGISIHKINNKIHIANQNHYYDDYDIGDVNIELVNISRNVDPGEDAYIKIKGTPNTEFEIYVEYNSGASTAEGLNKKFSDYNGYVEWSWKVGTNTNKGTYPIEIYNLDTFDSETFYFTIE